MLPDGVFFEGEIPQGFSLAICPSEGYIVVDVDRHGKVDGFDAIPKHLLEELSKTLSYPTKNDGRHYWFKYSGKEVLANKASGVGIDLRTHKGYVIWYPIGDVRDVIFLAEDSSEEMNNWLEGLFSYK